MCVRGLLVVVLVVWLPAVRLNGQADIAPRARQLHDRAIVVDTHDDTTQRLIFDKAFDIGARQTSGAIDIPRMREGGHMIDEDLGVLRSFATLGVRYLTLTHSLNTPWADSSGDKSVHNGLTAFGREVVHELNRLGVMVDISHVSDRTFFDALEVTRAPVLASHSSLRAISNPPRHMTDDMLRALATNGGVVMINYHAPFLSEEYRVALESRNVRKLARRVGVDSPLCFRYTCSSPRCSDGSSASNVM